MSFDRGMAIAELTTSSMRTMVAKTTIPTDRLDGGHRVDEGDVDDWSGRVVVFGLLDAHEDVTVDDAGAPSVSEREAVRGDAVNVAQVASACLVEERERIGGRAERR